MVVKASGDTWFVWLLPYIDKIPFWFFKFDWLVSTFVFCVFKALVALKKGSQLLKYGRKGKPKFCLFRLSNVSLFSSWWWSSSFILFIINALQSWVIYVCLMCHTQTSHRLFVDETLCCKYVPHLDILFSSAAVFSLLFFVFHTVLSCQNYLGVFWDVAENTCRYGNHYIACHTLLTFLIMN